MEPPNIDFWGSPKLIKLQDTPVLCVAEEATVTYVARLIAESSSEVVCVTREGQPVGTISDRELQAGAAALGREFGRVQAKHVMVRIAVTINSPADTSDVIDAVVLLRRVKARNAVVMREGRPIGVISLDALSRTSLHQVVRPRNLLSQTTVSEVVADPTC